MKKNRVPFLRLIPEIWKYQVCTKLLFVPPLAALRIAVRFMDGATIYRFRFLVPFLLFLFLIVFYICVSVDLYVKILYAGNVLDGTTESAFLTLKRAFAALPKCLNAQGLGTVLYTALISPLVGLGVGLWNVPYLRARPLYHILYAVLLLLFIVFGIAHGFSLHGLLLDGLSMGDSRRRSGALIREHWKHFWGQNLLCGLTPLAVVILTGTLFFLLPLSAGARILPRRYDAPTARSLMILLLFLGIAVTLALCLLAVPCYLLRMTALYREYLTGTPVVVPSRTVKRHPVAAALAVFYVLEIAALSSQKAYNFDELFPPLSATRIIAHRGGGNENAENTRSGLETAVFLGAYGSEIDIQRTSDGHYIVNHDDTFERVAGDARTPGEMTLEEIRNLGYPIPTLDEMLDASKGRILLFIELKGERADRQMCDDAVRMIRERDMVGETVLISFYGSLIEYVEERWPEIQTGYLTFLSPGENLPSNWDYLGLAEKSVTEAVIHSVHAQGRKVFVWTPNTLEAQELCLTLPVDAIITDNVVQAKGVQKRLNDRNGLETVLSVFRQT